MLVTPARGTRSGRVSVPGPAPLAPRRDLTATVSLGIAFVVVAAALWQGGCGGSRRAQRLERADLQARIGKLETPGLLIGEFPLESVLDGDTIRVAGLGTSLRLTGIDTEETFKTEKDKRLFEQGWQEYLRIKRGRSRHPVKMATPLGEDAKVFAKHFFDETPPRVRLERDDPMELRDRYGRYLAYVFAFKKGRWVNYNVECVRAGMSPYFTKYGYSKRFHKELVEAEREARAARRGIWSPDGMHYPDYPERRVWWDTRADFIKQIEDRYRGRPEFVVLSHWDALWRLEKLENKKVTILGLVSEARYGDRGPSRAVLSRQRGSDFSLIFFDKDLFGTSRVAEYRGEFIAATGIVSRYRPKGGEASSLQMVVKENGQIEGRPLDGDGGLPSFPEDDEDDDARKSVPGKAPAPDDGEPAVAPRR